MTGGSDAGPSTSPLPDAAPEVVDGHVHVWDLGARPQPWIDPETMPQIATSFSIAQLERTLADARVESSVIVQVLNRTDETEELLAAAHRCPAVGAVVGWADLADPQLERALDELLEHTGGDKLAGIRHQALAEPDAAAWLGREDVLEGTRILGRRGLVCDLMLAPQHLSVASEVLRRSEITTFVLDHGAKPPIAQGWGSDAAASWAQDIARLALLPHMFCKLSGLTVMAGPDWDVETLRPFADHLLHSFGPARVIFGSDWPVSLRAGTYTRTIGAARQVIGRLPPAERVAVLSDNARRLYRIPARLADQTRPEEPHDA